ncbi:MAG TPA: CHAT domain-containing tetratricopeptide repeat protein [Paludibaculum sp.]
MRAATIPIWGYLWCVGTLNAAQAAPPAEQAQHAQALAAQADAEFAGGKYAEAIRHAGECADLNAILRQAKAEVDCRTTVGRARVIAGEYDAALGAYGVARMVARGAGITSAEVTLLNNQANVYYFLGRYSEANDRYQEALEILSRNADQEWHARRLQMTRANVAVLYQKLGQYGRALGVYQELSSGRTALTPGERAQMLTNMGVLYRRLGDPYKALDRYREAQSLFAEDKDRDGEIGVIKNMGIALTLDLQDPAGARPDFERALQLAEASGNRREATQALLYLSEASRRLHRLPEAARQAERALAAATEMRAPEEVWKAQYVGGRVAEDAGQTADALVQYRGAIATIEAVRTGISTAGLRSGFLGDKRDVYDAAIALLARREAPDVEEIFHYMEQGRARALRDRVSASGGPTTIAAVQQRLAAGTALLEYWVAGASGAVIWITGSTAGLAVFDAPANGVIEAYLEQLRSGKATWGGASAGLGAATLGVLGQLGTPAPGNLIIVTDGRLQSLPFESLRVPGSADLVVDRYTVSYLPASSMLAAERAGRGWLAPWRRVVLAFASPTAPAGAAGSTLFSESLDELPGATEEARAVAAATSGRSQVLAGAANLKRYVSTENLRGIPLLHFATHAVADSADPDRSRLVFTSSDAGRPYDFLFAREAAGLDLSSTMLVTLAACDTELGQSVAGEGIQGLSRAFLGAGAGSTVSTLWRISDRPSAGFMRSFYAALDGGESVAEALRTAKLEFRRAGGGMAHPRYWAAYVLNGDAGARTPRSTLVALLCALGVAVLGLLGWVYRNRIRHGVSNSSASAS